MSVLHQNSACFTRYPPMISRADTEHPAVGGDLIITRLRSLVVVTDAESALLAKTVGPEAFNRGRAGEVIVGEEEPEAKDRLGKDVENSVCDDLAIHGDVARSISNTPDTAHDQLHY